MKKFKTLLTKPILATLITFGAISCEDGIDGIEGKEGKQGVIGATGNNGSDGTDGDDLTSKPNKTFKDFSVTNALIKTLPDFENVEISTLISSTDVLPASTPINGRANFQLAGSADGAGFLKEGDGFIYVVNCEDSYGVARIRLGKDLKPISGDYLLNSGVADFARQCSATMWEKEIHGGDSDLFLSASESINNVVKGIDPHIVTPTPTADFGLDALGQFSWENATPLPKGTYSGKTVIIGGDDDSSGSEGQVVMYLSESGDADLTGGKIYVLRTKQISDDSGLITDAVISTQYNESNLDFGKQYDVEFVEITDGKNLTKSEMETACNDIFATQFMRVEDVDYQKGADDNGRNVFFAVTGRGPGRSTYNDWGTVYKLTLNATNPLQGKLTQIISGNTDTNKKDGNAPLLQSPDNICVTENFIYTQEDPNSDARDHTAYIYQSNLNGENIKPVFEFLLDSDLAPKGTPKRDAEYGALIDVSDKIGVSDTFILALQPHYWKNDRFKELDGHFNTSRENDQASQIVILKGLPR